MQQFVFTATTASFLHFIFLYLSNPYPSICSLNYFNPTCPHKLDAISITASLSNYCCHNFQAVATAEASEKLLAFSEWAPAWNYHLHRHARSCRWHLFERELQKSHYRRSRIRRVLSLFLFLPLSYAFRIHSIIQPREAFYYNNTNRVFRANNPSHDKIRKNGFLGNFIGFQAF